MHVIGPLKCYNDDYQCYDYQCYDYQRYPLIRVLLSYPCFTLSSIRPDIRPSIRISVRPSGYPSVRPDPCFTLTLIKILIVAKYPLCKL